MDNSEHRRVVQAGEVIFSQGEPADCAYIIESGKIQVLVKRDGQQALFATLSPGDLVGEMALIDDRVRTATARAVVKCELIAIPCDYVKQKLDHSDPTLRLFLNVVMERYRDIHTRLMHVMEELAILDEEALQLQTIEETQYMANLKGRSQAIQKKILNAIHDISHQNENKMSHEPESQHTAAMLKKEHALKSALQNNELILHYQPIVNMKKGFVAGFEALIRWQSPELGMVSPLEFIPLAEKTGLIVPIGEWVIQKVCESAKAILPLLTEEQRAVFHFGINLSPRQFEGDELIPFIAEQMKHYQIDPQFLMFEITESLLMKDPEVAHQQIVQLSNLGGTIAIDDFGTGYSSFSYLHRYPFDTLKIDRAFVSTMSSHPKSRSIVQSLVQLAHNLQMKVIAEGIETPSEFSDLTAYDCDYGQGFYMSRPMPETEMADLIKQHYDSSEKPLPRAAG